MLGYWQILIPVTSNSGNAFAEGRHALFYDYVTERCGGISIYPDIQGVWRTPAGRLQKEKMRPVQFAVKGDQVALNIAKEARVFYQQDEMLLVKLSDNALFVAS